MIIEKRVLHIMSSDGGGISSFIKNKVSELNNSRIKFDVLTYDPVSTEFETIIANTGGKIYYMSNPKESNFKKFYQEVNKAMEIDKNRTIVHSHIQGYRFLPFYLIAKKNKISKLIVHAHTDLDIKQSKSLESRINRLINSVLPIIRASCGIKASRNIFGEKATADNRIMHIPNSIDTENFVKDADKEALRTSIFGIEHKDKLIIGNVSRFNKQKNHKFMVNIIKKMAEKTKDFVWVFVGEGELEKEIKLRVEKEKLCDYVLFLGRRQDVPDILKAMDIFALPSLYEGLPTVAIEAQAAGTTIFLADTITKECNLNLGLVSFLPLKSELWAEKILSANFKKVSNTQIMYKLNEKKFTNVESAKLYEQFINGQIKSYQI